jgi:hypothetical protein
MFQRSLLPPSPGWWWWRQQVPLKRWQTSTRLHSTTTQKTAIFSLFTSGEVHFLVNADIHKQNCWLFCNWKSLWTPWVTIPFCKGHSFVSNVIISHSGTSLLWKWRWWSNNSCSRSLQTCDWAFAFTNGTNRIYRRYLVPIGWKHSNTDRTSITFYVKSS